MTYTENEWLQKWDKYTWNYNALLTYYLILQFHILLPEANKSNLFYSKYIKWTYYVYFAIKFLIVKIEAVLNPIEAWIPSHNNMECLARLINKYPYLYIHKLQTPLFVHLSGYNHSISTANPVKILINICRSTILEVFSYEGIVDQGKAHVYLLLLFGLASKYLYVGFSYPFICMFATCRSSGDAAGSTSTNPWVTGCRCGVLFRSIMMATMMMTNTATLPMAIPKILPTELVDMCSGEKAWLEDENKL